MAETVKVVELERLLRRRKHLMLRLAYRYLSGRPLTGRTGYPWRTRGAGRWAGWQRQLIRVGVPAAAGIAATFPDQTAATAGGVALVAVVKGRRRYVNRRFHAAYVAPTLAAVANPLGLATVTLHVDPTLGSLTPRLAKPLSPAEEAVRAWYGEHVEPVLRWLPERVQRGLWTVQRRARPVTSRLEVFRRPAPEYGPRIELTINTPYLTREQRQMVSSIVTAKIPVSGLVESWDQVGPKVVARWTVRRRPPAMVGYDRVATELPKLAEWEFYLGDGVGGQAVTVSFKDDSPHIAVSAGSGAGKSVLALLIATQVLARGGQVVILDRKGSHRALLGLPNVDYCTRPEQMHNALLRTAGIADERNDLALHEDEGWDPGQRILVICEELNATIGQLANWWQENRGKGDPKRSPAVSALGNLLFMGRSAKVNVIAVAQMLTARAIGGPEARENFGIRCLARYTANNWKMLVPEAAMPKASRTLGRWQIVIGGTAAEVQVAYLTKPQVRAIITPEVPDSAVSSDVPGDGDMMTLRDAIDNGVLPWTYEAAKKRLQRRVGTVPTPRGKRGAADLYARSDLLTWVGK